METTGIKLTRNEKLDFIIERFLAVKTKQVDQLELEIRERMEEVSRRESELYEKKFGVKTLREEADVLSEEINTVLRKYSYSPIQVFFHTESLDQNRVRLILSFDRPSKIKSNKKACKREVAHLEKAKIRLQKTSDKQKELEKDVRFCSRHHPADRRQFIIRKLAEMDPEISKAIDDAVSKVLDFDDESLEGEADAPAR